MIQKLFLTAAFFATIGAQAQSSYQDRCRQYIQQYQTWAQEEQRRSGVPASITLGQGILETAAGESELATKANNHFGIKCKKSWTGETFAHDDDAPQECFRKYPNAYDSYRDHSDYLKNSPRYAPCFALNQTDYQGWARQLRKCGYATNPKYAQQLIKIIEDFQLQDHTYAAMRSAPANPTLIASTAAPAAATLMAEGRQSSDGQTDTPIQNGDQQPTYGEVVRVNGVRGFYARKGDVLLEYAIRNKIRYSRLLELNKLPDAPLSKDQFVAIENANRLIQIISHDGSQPANAPTAAKTFAIASTNSTPAPEIAAAAPVTAKSAPAKTNLTPAVATTKPAEVAPKPQPAATVTASSTPQVQNNPAPVSKPTPAPQNNQTKPAAAPAPKPFNIADEVAIDDRRARYIPPSERNYPPTTSNRTASPTAPASVTTQKPAQQTPVAPPTEKPATPATQKSEEEDSDVAERTAHAQAQIAQDEEEANTKKKKKKNQQEEEEDEEDDDAATTAKTDKSPQDAEFAKMKARFDQVVYAPSTAKSAPAQQSATPTSRPAPTPTPATTTARPTPNAAPTELVATGGKYHTVKSGETAYGIAKQYGISMKELMSLNNLNFEAIRVGQKLRVK